MLVQSISDEQAVDSEAESARDPELTATRARLRRVEALAAAMRRTREAEPEEAPAERPTLVR